MGLDGRALSLVVRVAGNFLNVDGLASLEYAVKFLGVPLLMVLGQHPRVRAAEVSRSGAANDQLA
jgi:carbonic anhydrase